MIVEWAKVHWTYMLEHNAVLESTRELRQLCNIHTSIKSPQYLCD